MANLVDVDGSKHDQSLFGGYETELKLVQADLSQKLDEISELSGEPRKSALGQAERALDEAQELVRASRCLPFVFRRADLGMAMLT
jgi:vesicle transport through interaction with t-SNAREs 1